MLECDSHSHIAKVSKPAKSSLGIIIVINWIFSLIIDDVISIFTNGSGTNTFKCFFFSYYLLCVTFPPPSGGLWFPSLVNFLYVTLDL